jgi:dsRNA-specific ribonuclease
MYGLFRKKLIDNKLDARLKSDPICALQELCMSRDWRLPEYKFFDEGDNKTFTYSVECTVQSFTVRGK